MSISHFVHESFGMCYQSYTTTSKNAHKFSHTSSVEVIGISQSILMHTSHYFHPIQLLLCLLGKHLTFSTETHGNVIPPPPPPPHKVSKTITMGIKKEFVRVSDVIFQD